MYLLTELTYRIIPLLVCKAYKNSQSFYCSLWKICLHCANTHITRPYILVSCVFCANGYCFTYIYIRLTSEIYLKKKSNISFLVVIVPFEMLKNVEKFICLFRNFNSNIFPPYFCRNYEKKKKHTYAQSIIHFFHLTGDNLKI